MTAPAQEQSVVCPQCGQDNLPGTAFCDNCGAELPLPQPATSAATMPPARMNPDQGPLSVAPPSAHVAQLAASGAAPSMPAAPGATTMACTNCGAQLPLNAKFCMECGTRVPPPPPEPQMVRPTHCQNCGSELLPNARFCMECGTPVELVPAEQVQASTATAPPFVEPAQAELQPAPTVQQPPTDEQQLMAQPAPTPEQPPIEAMAPQGEATQSVPPMQPMSGNGEYAAPVAEPAELAMPITQQHPIVEAPPMPEQPLTPAAQPTSAPRPLPRLVLDNGQELALPHAGEVLVGRSDPVSGITPDLDLTPHGGEAAGVSRRHAVLQPTNDGWQVVDLDSTNATRVNGQRVVPHTPTLVQPGDTIRFGRIELRFEQEEGEPSNAQPPMNAVPAAPIESTAPPAPTIEAMAPPAANDQSAGSTSTARVYDAPAQSVAPVTFAEPAQPAVQQFTPEPVPQAPAPELLQQQPAALPPMVDQVPPPAQQPAALPAFLETSPAPAQQPSMPSAAAQPVPQPSFAEQASAPVQLPAPDLQRRLPRLVLSDGRSLVLPHVGEVLVGRSDPVSGITPDLDLTPHGGEAAGVSRRHAVLQPTNDGWQVVDLDSTNATRVNGQRVVPHTPTLVQPGDTVRFGRIEMTFEV